VTIPPKTAPQKRRIGAHFYSDFYFLILVTIIFNKHPYQNALKFFALLRRLIKDRRFAPRHPNKNPQS